MTSVDKDLQLGSAPDLDGRGASVNPTGPVPGRSQQHGARFRPEVEGLRAVAATLVVVYHVWVGRVSGGVDVFFLLTGFLATGQLLRACERGRIDLTDQWGRTLRRLIPPTVVVLLGVASASFFFLPESRWPQTITEVVTSVLFVENWRLAADSVDYYAAHNTASVVQHFWSLSIQGQFALVFPLLVLGAVGLARRRGSTARSAVTMLLAAVTVSSFSYSLVLTSADQQLAYFHSLTRVWEFTAGGLLYMVVDRVRLPLQAGFLAGWLGILGLATCGMVLDVEGGFPGYLALWPVGCAAAVLTAGQTGHRLGVDRLLSSRPLQYIGSISFPLYLWHWPVLLLALLVADRPEPGPKLGLLVIATSVALAAVTRLVVEKPVQKSSIGRRSRWGNHRFALVMVVPLLIVTLLWQGLTLVRSVPAGAPGDLDYPGATATAPGFVFTGSPDASPIPPAVAAYEDWVDYRNNCWSVAPNSVLEMCAYVDPPAPAERTIVVVGDSHMQQFLPAVAPVARERNWRVLTLIRPGCPFSTTSESNQGEVDCIKWNESAIAELRDSRPDLVIAQGTHNVRVGRTEQTPEGFVEAWRSLSEVGVPVLAVRDNPRFSYSPPSCVDSYGRRSPKCVVPRAELYGQGPLLAPSGLSNVTTLDTANYLCDPTWCPPEIGNITVYLDDNHLTATFATSMAPRVGNQIAELLTDR